jgi:hypothetical protein
VIGCRLMLCTKSRNLTIVQLEYLYNVVERSTVTGAPLRRAMICKLG